MPFIEPLVILVFSKKMFLYNFKSIILHRIGSKINSFNFTIKNKFAIIISTMQYKQHNLCGELVILLIILNSITFLYWLIVSIKSLKTIF